MIFQAFNIKTIIDSKNALKDIVKVPVTTRINEWITDFNKLNSSATTTEAEFDNFFNGIDSSGKSNSIVEKLKDIQSVGNGAKASVDDVYSSIIGNTLGLKNATRIIGQYNSIVDNTGEQQKIFAAQVGKTNSSFGGYLGKLDGAKGSMFGYMGSIAATTAATVGLQLATAALSFGISAGLSFLAGLITKAMNSATEAIENAKQSANELKDEINTLDDYANTLVKLRGELDDSNTSMGKATEIRQELFKIQDDLIDTYDIEKNKINLVNGSLKEQLGLIEDLGKEKYLYNKSLNYGGYTDAVKQMQSQSVSVNTDKLALETLDRDASDYTKMIQDIYNKYGATQAITSNYMRGNLSSDAYTIDAMLEELYNGINKFKDKAKNTDRENQLESALTYISSLRSEGANKIIEENKEIYSQWLKYESDYSDEYIDIIRKRAILEEEIETGTAEAITQAKIEYDKVYQDALTQAETNGDTDVSSYLTNEFGDIEIELPAVEGSVNAINNFSEAVTELKSTFSDTLSSQSTFQSALDKIMAGTSLTSDEVLKLITLAPQLENAFTQTSDGWTISADNIISANNDVVKSTKDSIQSQINDINDLYVQRDKIMNDSSKSFSERTLLINALGIEEAEKQLPILKLLMSMLGVSAETTATSIEELQTKFQDTAKATNTLSSDFKTLSSAFAEYNEAGTISIDTALGLIDAGYASVVSFNKETGAIELNKDAYIQLANAKIEEQEVTLKLGLNEAQKEKFNTEREIVSNLGWGYLGLAESKLMMGKANAKLTDNQDLINGYEAEILALENLKNSISSVTTGEYGNTNTSGTSGSDPWKDEFDKAYAEKQHLLTMGKITEAEYVDWLDTTYKEYFSNLTKYQDEYWKYEEEVYAKREKLIIDSFKKQKDGYSDLVDENSLSSMEEYLKKWRELVETNYAGKSEFADEYESEMDAISEYEEKIADKRVDNEIKYWNDRKNDVEKYYQDQIDAIEKLEDEEDKLAKKEQLRLEILEAEKKLLDAKNNKNQLVFSNGKFSYEVDQEAVKSASEALSSANESLNDEIEQEQVDVLKEKMESDSEYFDTIIDILNAYKDKTLPVTESDSKVIEQATNSQYGQNVIQNAANEKKLSTEEYITSLGGVFDRDKYDTLIGDVGHINTNIEKAFEGISKSVVNNQSINNANSQSVNVGEINITIEGGTSSEMLNEFADKLGSKIRELTQKSFVN